MLICLQYTYTVRAVCAVLFEFGPTEMASPGFSGSDKTDIDKIKAEEELAPYVERELRASVLQWADKSKSIKILVAGKEGTGKSTLINGIVGKDVAKRGKALKAMTKKINSHVFSVNSIMVTIYDTPGLSNHNEREEEYISKIRTQCADIDLFLYCIKMSESRISAGGPDCTAMKNLTKALGEEIWDTAIIVLTFANEAVTILKPQCRIKDRSIAELFSERFLKFKAKVLELMVSLSIVQPIREQSLTFAPAGIKGHPTLPVFSVDQCPRVDEEFHWLSY